MREQGHGNRQPVTFVVILAALAVFASACSDVSSATPAATPISAVAQVSEAGQVTVAISWAGPAVGARVGVALDTHSVDLDSIDLTRQAVLRTPAGDVALTGWAAPKAGHHRSGELIFPQELSNGQPTIGSWPVELIIRDVAGVPERVFSWQR